MRKIGVLFVSLLLIFSLIACGTNPYVYKQESTVKKDAAVLPCNGKVLETKSGVYTEICRTDRQAMYADLVSGWFVVENLTSGKMWFSVPDDITEDTISKGISMQEMRSQINVGYIFRDDENISTVSRYINSDAGSYGCDGISTEKLPNGILVTYAFPDYGFTIPVEYTLEEDYFSARVLLDQIKEGTLCYVTEIILLPNLCSANWNASGYLFIPEGSGAIAHMNRGGEENTYEGRVYGSDIMVDSEQKKQFNQSVRMPVFGLVNNNDAIVGIIENGDTAASIVAQTQSEECGYNYIGSKYFVRYLFTKKMFKGDGNNVHSFCRASNRDFSQKEYSVRYYTISGSNISYVDIAGLYRDYLVDEKGLVKRESEPVMNIKYYGLIDCKKIFAGISYIGKMSLTTYEQAREFTEYLLENGASSLNVIYTGWSGDGLTNDKVQTKASPSGKLGGRKAFETLQEYLKDKKITFSPDVELLQFSSGGNGYSVRKNAVRSVFSDRTPLYRYDAATGLPQTSSKLSYCLTASSAYKAYTTYLNGFVKLKTDSVLLSSLGSEWYSSWNLRNTENGAVTVGTYCDILSKYADKQKVLLRESNAYAFPYASKITEVPASSGSDDFFDEDVPFYQIVLHGYIPMTSVSLSNDFNPIDSFLQTVETGSELLFDGIYEDSSKLIETDYNSLYSKTCNLWAQRAIENYKEYMPLLSKISNSTIIYHKRINQNLVYIIYDNGVNVLVNYEADAASFEGHEVSAKGFSYWE